MSRTFPIQDDGPARTCTLGYIQAALGAMGMSDKRMVRYVTQLITGHNFPRPLPCALRGQRGTTTEPTPRSRWLRAAVEAWLDDYLPPEAAAALDTRAAQLAAAELDASAAALGRPLRLVR